MLTGKGAGVLIHCSAESTSHRSGSSDTQSVLPRDKKFFVPEFRTGMGSWSALTGNTAWSA